MLNICYSYTMPNIDPGRKYVQKRPKTNFLKIINVSKDKIQVWEGLLKVFQKRDTLIEN